MNRTAKITVIIALLAGTTFLHYFTASHHQHYHIVYRTLYFVPIVLAGFWFGLWGALPTSATASIAYLPFVAINWQGFSAADFDRLMELVIYNVVALVAGILRDREREEQRRLQQAEKLSAMGKALSGAAHDMKTPLIAIGGFANLLLKQLQRVSPADPESVAQLVKTGEEKLNVVIKETRRLENMVRDMLDFSRPLQLERSQTSFANILQETFALVEEVAQRHRVSVVNESATELPEVSVDVMRMKQVLINLIINAVQASPEGEQVRVHCYQAPPDLVIDVIDCGCGIPLEKRTDVFSPFFTTKQEGTGLGLPIVGKIVDAHGGRISIVDNPQKGVTFRVKLPSQ